MTNIYPNQIPIEILNDPKREGERIVFRKLKEIEGNYEIFYSVDWTSNSKKNRPRRDGECDFILVHKTLGVICFEVKGGKVFKEFDNYGFPEFFSKDKKGEIHPIKNPYKQAKRTKNIIIDKWREYRKEDYINVQHAVIFPETDDPGEYKSINDLKEITLFKNHLKKDLSLEIAKLFELDASDNYDEMDENGVEYLKNIFLSIIPLKENLSEVIEYQKKIIDEQTNQFLANCIAVKEGFLNKIVFKGGAGTGKTHLAIEIAKNFSISGKTLILCFNRGLKNYLFNSLGTKSNIDVKSISECIAYLEIENFDENEVVEKLIQKNFFYDSIIIDEAQDFKIEWWSLIFNAINDKKSNIYIFYDNNQKIYNQKESLNFLNQNNFKFIELKINYRNTKNIHNLICEYYHGSEYKNLSLRGEKIKLLDIGKSLKVTLDRLLINLINEHDISPHDISILSSVTINKQYLNDLLESSHFKFTNCEVPLMNHLIIDTVQRYKGLENEVVILINTSDNSEDLNLIYTAFSRAKLLLIIIDHKAFIEKIDKLTKISNN